MNKLRVFQNVKNKRTVSGFPLRNLGTVLLLLLLLPYLITFFFGNLWIEEEIEVNLMLKEQLSQGQYKVVNQTAFGEETIPLELYVADRLARVMGQGYEKEALKAQAILIRTNLLQGESRELFAEDAEYGRETVPDECFLAAAETKGMCLVYEGKPVYGAYFKVSNGATRNAGEILKDTEYPYLSSVICDRDFLSQEYTAVKAVSVSEFEKSWEDLPETDVEIKETGEQPFFAQGMDLWLLRDSAGYVQFVKHHEKWVTGENFRYEFSLASSDFQVQLQEDELLFTTKGNGHGIGMSQFGANEMAKEGKNYREILTYFFKDTAITKIE